MYVLSTYYMFILAATTARNIVRCTNISQVRAHSLRIWGCMMMVVRAIIHLMAMTMEYVARVQSGSARTNTE